MLDSLITTIGMCLIGGKYILMIFLALLTFTTSASPDPLFGYTWPDSE
ncbi:TPA: hypothetical protein ACX6QG_001216 [Photobacterium damselae]